MENGKHLLIADDVDAMIEGVEQIWSNQNLAKTLVEFGYELVQSKYSWDAVGKNVEIALNELNI